MCTWIIRYYRRSCEPDFGRLGHTSHGLQALGHGFHHKRGGDHLHSGSCDYARRTGENSAGVETGQHFGLPILSISEPSPPDETERVDEYL